MSEPSVLLNHTYEFTLENFSFDSLPIDVVINTYKDGRVFSHFVERWMATKFPLTWVDNCKEYDFVDNNNDEIKYDEKTFTTNGVNFAPSIMKGGGRHVVQSIFEEKANKLIYAIASNVSFPNIKIRFVRGSELIKKYPNGCIRPTHHDAFFA